MNLIHYVDDVAAEKFSDTAFVNNETVGDGFLVQLYYYHLHNHTCNACLLFLAFVKSTIVHINTFANSAFPYCDAS